MATKDWKKTSSSKWIIWEKDDISIQITTILNTINNKIERYEMDVYKNYNLENNRWFKTKTNALKFARNYMKKH